MSPYLIWPVNIWQNSAFDIVELNLRAACEIITKPYFALLTGQSIGKERVLYLNPPPPSKGEFTTLRITRNIRVLEASALSHSAVSSVYFFVFQVFNFPYSNFMYISITLINISKWKSWYLFSFLIFIASISLSQRSLPFDIYSFIENTSIFWDEPGGKDIPQLSYMSVNEALSDKQE